MGFGGAVLSMDAIDMSGKHEVDLDTNIWKVSCLLGSNPIHPSLPIQHVPIPLSHALCVYVSCEELKYRNSWHCLDAASVT